ncbi:MAG: intein-containing Rv2578c family radical SAM protein [Natronosporangium sp.]
MRWSHLVGEAGGPAAEASRGQLPLGLPDAVVRTFDTPGFAGMTFFEVRAKSILNRVPGSSRMPFEWTLNPYRGCSHACVYCVAGDTRILLADGRTRPLAELAVGDRIYGTVRRDGARRYVTTEVLAHWSTVKPAYRVVLEDGTELVGSGDHRFLTDRGWRRITGRGRSPHLTAGTRLVGVGWFAAPPVLDGLAVGSERLGVVSVEPLGRELPLYDITTGTGDFIANGVVSHNCFARSSHSYLDLDSGEDFDRRIVVKVNAGELLRRELAAARWRGQPVAMGTNVDCYQRAEGRYRLMPEILAALRDFANPFSILTKGTLILRDLPLLREAMQVTDVRLAVSIGFLDERRWPPAGEAERSPRSSGHRPALWRTVEPGTPSPRRRLDVVRRLSDAGFRVSVLMAPILPGLTDDDASIEATVAAIAGAGAASLTPLPLHLRPGAREWFGRWLARCHPELVEHYRRLYAGGAYAPKAYQRELTARVRQAARRHGLAGPDDQPHRTPAPAPGPPEQPTLW